MELPRRLLEELGAIPSYYLRYYYATREVLAEQLTGDRARRGRGRDRARAAPPVPPTRRWTRSRRCSRGEAARSTAKRPRAGRVPRRRQRRRPHRQRPQRGRDLRACRRRRRRAACAGRRQGATPLAQAPLAPELLGLVQHVAAYERLAVDGGDERRPRHRAQSAARSSAHRPGLARRGLLERLLDSGRRVPAAVRAGGCRMSAPLVLAIDGGNSKTDLALVRRRRLARLLRARPAEFAASPGRRRLRARAHRPPRRSVLPSRLAIGTAGRSRRSRRCCSPASICRSKRRALRRRHASPRLGEADHRRQRHVRRPAGGHRARLGRGRGLRRRDQLRRARPGRASGPLRRARIHHGGLGRGLRRRPRRPVGRGAQRGWPRPSDRARTAGPGPLRLEQTAGAGRGDPSEEDPDAPPLRALADRPGAGRRRPRVRGHRRPSGRGGGRRLRGRRWPGSS